MHSDSALYAGSVVTFTLVVRDRTGRLYSSDTGSGITLTVHAVNSEGEVGPALVEGTAEPDSEQGTYFYDLDTAAHNLSAGRYLLRLLLPYGQGKVLWQDTFILRDPDTFS